MQAATKPIVLVAITLTACASPVFADLYVRQTGPIEPKGSWMLPLAFASPTSDIDLIGVRITSGDPFDTPAMQTLIPSDWNEILNTGTLAASVGPATNYVGYLLHFSGDVTDPVEFDVVACSNEQFIGAYHGSWSGEGHFVELTESDWHPSCSELGGGSPIPAPGASMLALTGLGCIAVFFRRLL